MGSHRTPPRSRIYLRYVLITVLVLLAVYFGAVEQILVHHYAMFIDRPPGTGATPGN